MRTFLSCYLHFSECHQEGAAHRADDKEWQKLLDKEPPLGEERTRPAKASGWSYV